MIGDTFQATYSYLALGDSYTIGESVPQEGSFPYQLKNLLEKEKIMLEDPVIIAKTGWTTDELIAAIEEKGLKQRFDLVTLLIGVNNQYRGYSREKYRKEFKMLLNTALEFGGGDGKKVFVISIPDWGVTPFGYASGRDVKIISSEIEQFNLIAREESEARGIVFTDITPSSRAAEKEPGLIAEDGLHPSSTMYKAWAEALVPRITSVLK